MCGIIQRGAKMESREPRTLFYVGSSERDLSDFPQEVKDSCTLGLIVALKGQKYYKAKPLRGFGGNSVLEIVEDHRSGTYRAVYTVKFKKAVYVLHAFQKKSKKKIETPKQDIELIKKRLKRAEAEYKETFGSGE
jgi:phage-related protein